MTRNATPLLARFDRGSVAAELAGFVKGISTAISGGPMYEPVVAGLMRRVAACAAMIAPEPTLRHAPMRKR